MDNEHEVVIIGAGWAGLSAAFHLAKAGVKSTILEASPQAGGRARSINFGKYIVDNGQHLLIGAYHNTLSILKSLNINLDEVFYKHKLDINTIGNNNTFKLKLPFIFYPLNIILGVLLAKGCSIQEKINLIKFCYYLKKINFKLNADIPLREFFETNKQSANLVKHFWEPLALAALSTPIDVASAQIFVTLIGYTFNFKRKNSDLIFTKIDLSNILPNPILEQFKSHINIVYNYRVKSISQDLESNKFTIHGNKDHILAKKIIIAVPAEAAHALLTNSIFNASTANSTHANSMVDLINNLSKFNHETITTIYYELKNALNFTGLPMYGLVDTICHWFFLRPNPKQPNLLSVVITANKAIEKLTNDQLANEVFLELKRSHINLKQINFIAYKIVKEKRAAFSCVVGINSIRPNYKSPIQNLYFAGDYTKTELPATLEGAIISGLNCASYCSKS